MNCKEALAILYDVLDNEASQVDVVEFKRHLDACAPCFENYRLQEEFQKFVVLKSKVETVSNDCLEKLKSNVMSELDRVDRELAERPRQSTVVSPLNKLVAVAASLLFVVFAGYLGNNLYHHHVTYVPLEQAHWNVEQAFEDFRSQARTASSVDAMQENFGYSIAPNVGEFALAGGELTEIMGVKMGHFVYTSNGSTVSVFVAPAADFTIPEELYKHAIDTKDGRFYDHHCVGCRLMYHEVGDAVIVTATTDRDVELLNFVPGTAVI